MSAPIAGLSAATTYHWQLCVNDGSPSRNICSSDQTFVTKSAGGSSGIAFVSTRGVSLLSDIFVMDTAGGGQTNLTNTVAAAEDFPAWSPDGKRLVYSRGNELWTMNADGSGQAALTSTPTVVEQEPAWSPDGSKIAFHALTGTDTEIYTINAVDGSGQLQLTNNAFEDRSPAWSPEGGKLAFDTNRDGIDRIYVMKPDGTGQTRFTVSIPGIPPDTDPAWSPFRQRLHFTGIGDGSPGADYTHIGHESIGEGDVGGGQGTTSDGAGGNADDSRASIAPFGDGAVDVTEFVAFQRKNKSSATDWEIFKTTVVGPPTNLTNNAASDTYPAWSPRP